MLLVDSSSGPRPGRLPPITMYSLARCSVVVGSCLGSRYVNACEYDEVSMSDVNIVSIVDANGLDVITVDPSGERARAGRGGVGVEKARSGKAKKLEKREIEERYRISWYFSTFPQSSKRTP